MCKLRLLRRSRYVHAHRCACLDVYRDNQDTLQVATPRTFFLLNHTLRTPKRDTSSRYVLNSQTTWRVDEVGHRFRKVRKNMPASVYGRCRARCKKFRNSPGCRPCDTPTDSSLGARLQNCVQRKPCRNETFERRCYIEDQLFRLNDGSQPTSGRIIPWARVYISVRCYISDEVYGAPQHPKIRACSHRARAKQRAPEPPPYLGITSSLGPGMLHWVLLAKRA